MKKTLREAIREEIKKLLLEDYETGDLAIDNYKDVFSKKKVIKKVKTQPPPNTKRNKKTKKSNTKKLKATPDGNLDVNALLSPDQEDYTYYDTEGVKDYYKKNHNKTIKLIEEDVTIKKSPDLNDMFGTISDDEKIIYDTNYSNAKTASATAKSNIQGNNDTMDALYTASNLCQIPLYTLYALAAVESNGLQQVTSPSRDHGGLFQFGEDAAQGAGFASRDDVYNSSDGGYKYKLNNSVAACNFMKANHKSGISKDIGLSTYSAYLMHQQGATGSKTIYNNFKNEKTKLIDNQKSNVSSINNNENLIIDTNRKWMIGWLGRIKGFEDAFVGISGGEIRYPGQPVYSTENQAEFESSGDRASWVNKLGVSLKGYPNFDSVHAINGQGMNNNYRAGINPKKGEHNEDFFRELNNEFGIENVVTLNTEAKNASDAAKNAGLNVLYYPIGTANQLTTNQLEDIFDLLDEGNTLVHCTHGADRTGEVIGRYYVEKGIMNKEQAKQDHAKYQGKPEAQYKQNFKFIEQGK